MEAPFSCCMQCDEVIADPICGECVGEGIRKVLREMGEGVILGIEGLKLEGETKCICCGQTVGLCERCIREEVFDYLIEKNPEKGEEFLERFGLRGEMALKYCLI